MLNEALKIAKELGYISVPILQRRLRIKYEGANLLIEHLIADGVLIKQDGAKPYLYKDNIPP